MVLKRLTIAAGAVTFLTLPPAPEVSAGSLTKPKICGTALPEIKALKDFTGPVSGPLFLNEMRGNKKPGTVNLISINTQNLPDVVLEEISPHYKSDRRDCLSQLAKSFDIAAMQENWVGLPVEKIMPTFRTQFNPVSTASMSMSYHSGLSVSSSLPLQEGKSRAYSVCSGWLGGANDCMAMKGFEVVNIKGVTIVNTHLDAGKGRGDEAARRYQIKELSDNLPKSGRLVVMGDFNTRRHSVSDSAAIKKLLKDNNLTVIARSDSGLDIIAARDVKINWVGVMEDRMLTDHPALVANLDLN